MIPTPSFLSTSLYQLLISYSVIILFCFNLDQMYKTSPPLCKNLARSRSHISGVARFQNTFLSSYWLWAGVEAILFSCIQQVVSLLNRPFGNLLGTGANYFGHIFFPPLFLSALCFLLWTDPLKRADLLAPSYPLALIIYKLACFFAGCCSGFECPWGIYNYYSGSHEFPSQLLEAAVAIVLFVVIMRLRGKVKIGTLFPIYVILYSATRFFTEFTRVEPNVFLIFKTYHFCCLAGLIYGLVMLVVIRKFGHRISQFFESRMAFIRNTES